MQAEVSCANTGKNKIYLKSEIIIYGISQIVKGFSKANNKYMKSYDYSKPNKYIMYLDANNLYDQTMSQYLPYSKFKWLNQKEIDKFDVNSIGKNNLDGYLLEIDLEYRDKSHEFHSDYPLAICCQNIIVISQMNRK